MKRYVSDYTNLIHYVYLKTILIIFLVNIILNVAFINNHLNLLALLRPVITILDIPKIHVETLYIFKQKSE